MKPLEFTHTTYESPCYIYSEQIFAVFYMPNFKSVALIGPGGVAVPVKGTLQEIESIVSAAKAASNQCGQVPKEI